MADERPIEDQIRFELKGSVAWITIDRPQVGNALNPPGRNRIRDLINDLNVSKQARCIVITATGEKLSVPVPTSAMSMRRTGPRVPDQVAGDPRRMMLDGQYTLFPAILDSDIPIIAAVNGTAAGMGAHLALACDLVIAADNAKFVEVFARRGLVPDALGPWLLPRIIGVRKTMELMLFARTFRPRRPPSSDSSTRSCRLPISKPLRRSGPTGLPVARHSRSDSPSGS